MGKYIAYFKMAWQDLIEYRADIVVYTFSSAITPLVGLAIWLAVARTGAQLSFDNSQLVLYFMLVIFVSVVTSAWSSYFVGQRIVHGEFIRYLTKPFSCLDDFATENVVEKLYKLPVVFLTMAVLGFFLLKDSSVSISLSPLVIVGFLISLLMAAVISFLIDFTIGLTAFWLNDIEFVRHIYKTADQFLSGELIPLAFLPLALAQFNNYLPFRYMLSFPIEVLMGTLSPNELVFGFTMQSAWFIGSIVVYNIVYRIGVRSYEGYST